MKNLIIAGILLLIAGCTTTEKEIRIQYKSFTPPESILTCNAIQAKDFPNPETLTNKQLHNFILKLYKENKVCAANMKAIRKYIGEYNNALKSSR